MLFRDMPTTYVHFQCSVGPAFFLIFLSEFKVPSLLASSLSPPPHSTSLSLSLSKSTFPSWDCTSSSSQDRYSFFLVFRLWTHGWTDTIYIQFYVRVRPNPPTRRLTAETEEQEKASTAYLYLLACIFCCASTYLQKLCDERGGEAACCRPAVRAVYLAGC
jgi:hypothetical protein